MPQESVKVMVRVRRLIAIESQCQTCLETQDNCVNLQAAELTKSFAFDQVFTQDISQEDVYESSAFGLVESVLEGYNATMFTYGQTGSGKTYTMIGGQKEQRGVIPRTFEHIMNVIKVTSEKTFLVRCSYIQIYNDEIRDLFEAKGQRLDIKESTDRGVFVKDLSIKIVKSQEDLFNLLHQGNSRRVVGKTAMNDESSRSHVIFTIYVESQQNKILGGKFNLVDLAGSERQSSTKAQGETLKEACKINLSLQALGNVIGALVDGRTNYVPYRDSKLTRLLQDSLGGNTKTIMLATISPADKNYAETLSTLRYASRAKLIQNKPKINEDPKDALLKQYAEEIKKLKDMVEQSKPEQSSYTTKSLEEQHQKQIQAILQKEKEEKLLLEKLIKDLEQKTIQVVQTDDESAKRYRQMKKRFKVKQEQHEKLLQDRQKQEEDLLNMEKNYQCVQDQVDEQKKIIRKLRTKCKQTLQEIEDLYKVHEKEKQELLDAVRSQQHESNIMQAIINVMLSSNEYEAIKASVTFDDSRTAYKCPPFIFRDKKVTFPRLPFHEAMDMIDKQKSERDIAYPPAPDSIKNNQSLVAPIKEFIPLRRPYKLQSLNK